MNDQYTIPGYIIKGIEKSIEISMNCKDEDEKIHPKVGAVLIKDEKIVETAYRGEINPGDHAEFILLEKKCKLNDFRNTILITTLEPCTRRGIDKRSCAERIIEKGIKEVWIGIPDPNAAISTKGSILLIENNIKVCYFPPEYSEKVKELIKEFWDYEIKKYRRNVMLSPPLEIKSIIEYTDEEILAKFKEYLKHCVQEEAFFYCLGEKLPLIKDYNLFNFTSKNDVEEDNKKIDLYYLWDYEYPKKSLDFKNFVLDVETSNKKIGIIRGPSGIGKSRLLNYLKYHFSVKAIKSKRLKIPILIDLNYWSRQKTIFDLCKEKLMNWVSIDDNYFRILLKGNQIIILMDAFNEIKLKDRINFIKDFTSFIDYYPDLTIIITMTTDTKFLISSMEEKMITLWMNSISLKKFKPFYEKIDLSIDFDEFINQVNLHNLNKLIKIPLFLNYVLVYLKIEGILPNSKYTIINNLLKHYFEDFLRKKYSIYEFESSFSIWQEALESLSYHMHTKLEDNKIDSTSLKIIFSNLIADSKKKFKIPQEVNFNDLIEFFINYNILKLENNYYKFNHDILFEYYCGLELSKRINQKNKLGINKIFHKNNMKESLIIAFPLIKNEKFLKKCKKANKFIYIGGILEKNRLNKEEINFSKNYLSKKIQSKYFYIQKLSYSLMIKLMNFIDEKEEFIIKIIENEKAKRFETNAILELGKLKTDKAKTYLIDFKGDPTSLRYRGVALCYFEDETTQELLIDDLEEEWHGADYPSMIAEGLSKSFKRNKLSEKTLERLLNLFIDPPKKLKFNFKDKTEYNKEYSISWSFRKGLKKILIEKNDPSIIPKLIDVLDYEKLNYFEIIDVISKNLDQPQFNEICEMLSHENLNYNIKIPLVGVIKNSPFKLDFNYILKLISNIPEEIKERVEDIFYGDLIELLTSKDRFLSYEEDKLTEILPPLMQKGHSIQKAIIEVITNFFPKYFFEVITDFRIYYLAFEVLIEVIIRNKYFDLKDWLIKHAKMCIPNWMHGVRKAFHNWFLFFKILNALIEIDCYSEVKELLCEILDRIDDWRRVNPVSFKIINKFEDSDKFPFIERIYKGYSEIPDDERKHSQAHFIGGIIHPYDSENYINFNLEILKDSAKSDYILAEDVIWNLITLKPKGVEDRVMHIYNLGVNNHALSRFIKLISALSFEKGDRILKRHLSDEDWLVRNTAFNEIQKNKELNNLLWYDDEEKT